ncbi:RICIN domain-containing protein [Streptomyces sp. NPDC088794]|uniref:RICIN domain-containing protein n=1 Tax=Streptomyces sp. NPDC088794 TaxID=3365902 RepID=UPI00380C4002
MLLVPVAFSSTQGNVTTEAATPAGSRPPERPGPATSRSQSERPPLTPQSAPSSTAADDERGPLGNAGHGGVLAADGTGAWLAEDQDRRDGAERAWRLTPAGDGGLRLTTGPDAGRALALTLDTASDRVLLRPYADAPGQQWSVVPVHGHDGTFRLHNAARTDGCLSAHGKGGALTVEPCGAGDRTQEWTAR